MVFEKRSKIKGFNKSYSFYEHQKRESTGKGIFNVQFSYSPLIWRFYCREQNNQTNRTHEPFLQINTSFDELLETNNSVSVHHLDIQVLAV